MTLERPHLFAPNGQPSRSEWERMATATEQQDRRSTAGGVLVQRNAAGFQAQSTRAPARLAVITTRGAANNYGWRYLRDNGSGALSIDTEAESGTPTVTPAYESNQRIDVPPGSPVRLRASADGLSKLFIYPCCPAPVGGDCFGNPDAPTPPCSTFLAFPNPSGFNYHYAHFYGSTGDCTCLEGQTKILRANASCVLSSSPAGIRFLDGVDLDPGGTGFRLGYKICAVPDVNIFIDPFCECLWPGIWSAGMGAIFGETDCANAVWVTGNSLYAHAKHAEPGAVCGAAVFLNVDGPSVGAAPPLGTYNVRVDDIP